MNSNSRSCSFGAEMADYFHFPFSAHEPHGDQRRQEVPKPIRIHSVPAGRQFSAGRLRPRRDRPPFARVLRWTERKRAAGLAKADGEQRRELEGDFYPPPASFEPRLSRTLGPSRPRYDREPEITRGPGDRRARSQPRSGPNFTSSLRIRRRRRFGLDAIFPAKVAIPGRQRLLACSIARLDGRSAIVTANGAAA